MPGAYFILDKSNGRVRLVYQGIISTWAGNGFPGVLQGDGGLALQATFNRPAGMGVDAIGNVYIADTANDVIRKATIYYQNPPTASPTYKPSPKPTVTPTTTKFKDAEYTIMVGTPIDSIANIGFCTFNGQPNPLCNLRSAWQTCVNNIPLNPCYKSTQGNFGLVINCNILLPKGMSPHILNSQYGAVFNSNPMTGWASACYFTEVTISISGGAYDTANDVVIIGDGTPGTQLIRIAEIPFLSVAFSNMTIGGFGNSSFDFTGLQSASFSNITWGTPAIGSGSSAITYPANDGLNYRGVAVTLEGMKQVTFTKCIFDSQVNTGKWGAVYIEQSSIITFTDCTFRNNIANLTSAVSSTNVQTNSFTNVTAASASEGVGGAAVSIIDSTMVSFFHCSFINNKVLAHVDFMNSNGGGGAIFALSSSNINIARSQFINNIADLIALNGTTSTIATTGGAINLQYTSNVTITQTTFINNIANLQGIGGAIYALGPATGLIISKCSFQGNSAAGYAAGIATTFDRYCWGGALFLNSITNVEITDSNFVHNEAGGLVGLGGTIYATKLNTFIFSNNTVSGDSSSNDGGVMYFLADSIYLSMQGCTFRNTFSRLGNGGAFYFGTNISYVNFAGIQIVNASAAGSGGAIYIGSSCSLFSFGGLQPYYFDGGAQSLLSNGGSVDATALDYNLGQGPITGYYVAFDATTASSLSCDDGVQVGTYVGGSQDPNCYNTAGWDTNFIPGVNGIAPAYSSGKFLLLY